MKKTISILLILLGIFFISLPTIQNLAIKNKTKDINEVAKEITHEEILENIEIDVEFDYAAIEDVNPSNVIFGTMNFDKRNLIGQLSIPAIWMDLPLLKGITNSNLAVGATTMKKDQSMGVGNYTLAGHYMKDKNLLFGSLMDVKIGDGVYITDKETVYEYKIYDTVIVEDTAMYMLEDNESLKREKPIISLMTCYYSSKSGKRFFALGELVDEYPYE